jgi:hypothetical protein
MNGGRLTLVGVALLVASVLLHSGATHAQYQSGVITRSTSLSGTTVLTLKFVGSGCFAPGHSTSTVEGNGIAVHTVFSEPGCIGDPPAIFAIATDVGLLKMGHFTVNWTWDEPVTYPNYSISTEIDVVADDIPLRPVPTISTAGYSLLMLMLALFGAKSLIGRASEDS